MRTHWAIRITVFILLGSGLRGAPAPDIEARLKEADRLAWLNDWYGALPIYIEAQQAATATGDRPAAMYAKFGRMRGEMQTQSLAELSEEIAQRPPVPHRKPGSQLRLRGLTVKGDIDLEWNVDAAQQDWRQVMEIAKELDDKGWQNRATGELAMVAFLKGNTGEAGSLIQQALTAVTQAGDVGGELRYMGAIANGLLSAGYPTMAVGYVDRALKFANEHPETGFPFVVYSTKALTLLALNRPDEAEQLAKTAMAAANAGDRRIKETELLMLLGQIAEKRGQHDRAVEYLEQAISSATAGHVQRLLADAEEGVATIYRARGDLNQASRHALAAVAATETAGNRFMLPVRLGILADVYAAQGNLVGADRTYDQATDIVEGIMVNVPSREAQARLISMMSGLYMGHFRLAAERLNAPAKAYEIIERARGRAVADVLRTLPDINRPIDVASDRFRTISRLQVRLMKTQVPTDRKRILDDLWEAEQRSTLPTGPRQTQLTGKTVSAKAVQQRLAADEVILEYVLSDPRSYCMVISRGGVKLVPLPSRKQIEPLVDRFTEEIRSGKAGRSAVARELYEAVLRPIDQWQPMKRMFIVPDAKLHLVPFDSMLTLNGASPHIVTLVPSASVWYLLRTRPRRAVPERPLLAVGGVPYDRMFAGTPTLTTNVKRSDETRGMFDAAFPAKLALLPSAQAEVLAAARLFGPSSVVLSGEQATESGLKAQNLRDFEILHFAVHAFADPNFPERAALVLLSDASGGEDGLLQPREIARFTLNASVVVLSACDTAVGPIVGQEGVLNIARAFLLAGAHSVVTTLWSVSDATSTALMRRFYENITAGQDVAEALMRSKAAILDQFGPDALPTVAAFQLVGVGDRRITFKTPPPKIAGATNSAPSATH